MRRIIIPNSGVTISRLGLGCARLFDGSGSLAAERLVREALDCGIRHFDTAPSYGSEEILGAILSGERDVTIATKVGIERKHRPAGSESRMRRIYWNSFRPILTRFPRTKSRLLSIRDSLSLKKRGKHSKVPLEKNVILRELEISLRLLRRSRVDIYLIHEPDRFVIDDETREFFEDLQKQGVIGAFGTGTGNCFSPEKTVFGTVTQALWGGTHVKEDRSAFIFHGVFRHAHRSDGPAALRNALEMEPNSAFLFSPSVPRQIRDLSNKIKQPISE